ncbi:MAG TPA: biosynthetic arginine decarboxylase [Gemmatimonadaceae bacterium]|nr:biosynthetic arginine decarboxylase [Gemmatimonadaceae bacterium]
MNPRTITPPVATPAPGAEHAERRAPSAETGWSIDDARSLYNVEGWGLGFFDINARGHVVVRPERGHPERELDLFEVATDLAAQGVGLPLLLRFSDILRSRVETLTTGFRQAMKEYAYDGGYTLVYPVKVNQQRHVVDEIVHVGGPMGVGLECGSKPELQVVLAMSEDSTHTIVCNGYKDEEFMRLALMGQKLGHTVFVVLEQISEVETLLRVAREMDVRPTAGVRIKLASEGFGRWAESGGEKSKFGVSASELVKIIERLKAEGALDFLKLIHFHLGSQITDIRYIKSGLQEVARFYEEMHAAGVNITHVDVGGGLGIDYDGSSSTVTASVNYSVQEYANDVVYTLAEACREHDLPMPHLITESGRAVTAHHALLLINVIGVESPQSIEAPPLTDDDHPILHEMQEELASLTARSVREVYHDATFAKERAQALFISGVLSLRGRALAEQLYTATINAAVRIAQRDREEYEDIIDELEAQRVDRYFCNFSVFQSLPDSWAIDHLFPIMPIHRLGEFPDRRGTLQDITCDSDGKIDRFTGGKNGRPALELHPFKDGEEYILGIFLTGAYQEILGDLHNLFGDTNAVHIRLREGGYEVTDLVHGDTVTEVLNYVQFRAADLLATFRRKVGNAKGLSRGEANRFIAEYVAGLEGYTYLEGDGTAD